MAIALDTSTSAGGAASWSHSCTGSNLVLVVSCYAITDTVTSVTYNGVSMTQINKTSFPGSGRQGVYLYYLINPATGSNTVLVTGGTGLGAASYTGAKQSGQPDAFASNSFSASPGTCNVTVVGTGCWLVGALADPSGSESAGAGTTIRATDANGLAFADSNGTVGTGSQTLTINYGGGSAGMISASIAPAAVATTGYGYSMLMRGV